MKTRPVRDSQKALLPNGLSRMTFTLFVSCSFGAVPFAPTRSAEQAHQAFEVARSRGDPSLRAD